MTLGGCSSTVSATDTASLVAEPEPFGRFSVGRRWRVGIISYASCSDAADRGKDVADLPMD